MTDKYLELLPNLDGTRKATNVCSHKLKHLDRSEQTNPVRMIHDTKPLDMYTDQDKRMINQCPAAGCIEFAE